MKRFISMAIILSFLVGIALFPSVNDFVAKADNTPEVYVYYNFDSSNANDLGTAGFNGELVNNPTFVTGRKGGNDKAIQLDGTNYIKVNSSAFKPTGGFTISFWMSIPSTVTKPTNNRRVISTGAYGLNSPGICLGANVDTGWSNIFSGIGSPTGDTVFKWGTTINSVIADDTWHHVAGVIDTPNRKITIYYDGVQNTSYYYSAGESIESTNPYTAIGAYMNNNGAISESFKGKLDDVMVIKKVLSSTEITDLKNGNFDNIGGNVIDPNAISASDVRSYYTFNGRNANDSGSAQYKGTLVGKPKFVDGRNGVGDKAIELNGSNYVQLDANAFKPTGNFTVSYWAKMSSTTPIYTINQRVISTGVWGINSPGIIMGINNDIGGWSNIISGIGGSGASIFQSGNATDAPLSDNTWHHMAGVFDATNKIIKIYLDGSEKASYGFTADQSINTTQVVTAIGGYLNNGSISESFVGQLDDVMIIAKALTVAQIALLKAGTLVTIVDNVGQPEDNYSTDDSANAKPNKIVEYNFDNSDATDSGSYGYNGVLKNSPTFLSGRTGQGKSIMFNGTNSIEVDSKPFNPDGNFTISFWAKVPSNLWTQYDNGLGWRNCRLISTGVFNNTGSGMLLGLHHNQQGWTNMISGIGAIDNGQGNADIWQWGNAAPAPLWDDTWHNIVGVFNVNDGNIQVYLDGVKATDYQYDITKYTTVTAQTKTLIGGHFGIATGSTEPSFQEGFIGQVDDLIVLDKALSLYEINRLKMDLLFVDDTPRVSPNYVKYTFNNDTANEVIDESGNNVNGTKVGNISYVDGRKAGEKAISLTDNAYIKLDAKAINPRGQSFSVLTWVKFSPNISNGMHRIISTGAYGDFSSQGYMIGLNKDEFNGNGIATLKFGIGSPNGSSTIWETDIIAGKDILDNKWHCIIVTFDMSYALATIYLDCFSVGGDRNFNPAVNSAESAADFIAIGGHLDNGVIQDSLGAQIDDLAIYDSVLGIENIISLSTDSSQSPNTLDNILYFIFIFLVSGLLLVILIRRKYLVK